MNSSNTNKCPQIKLYSNGNAYFDSNSSWAWAPTWFTQQNSYLSNTELKYGNNVVLSKNYPIEENIVTDSIDYTYLLQYNNTLITIIIVLILMILLGNFFWSLLSKSVL